MCEKIKPGYDSLSTNVRVFSKKKRKKRVIAEIDVLAIKENKFDIYEVKCSNRITKARHQLKKIRKLMPKVNNVFFFCGESGIIKELKE